MRAPQEAFDLAVASDKAPKQTSSTRPDHLAALALLIVGAALLRATIAGHALLSGDEAYYWLWSLKPQLSYFDHPGMVAWWITATTWAFGTSELTIRLPAILSTALVTALVYDCTKIAFDDARAGLWAALWLNLTILFGAAAVTVTPDSPLLAFWALALWALVRLVNSGRPVWLYVLGAALGLGFDSKYTMTLIAPGIIVALAVFPAGRVWWRRVHTWLAILLAAVATLPVLVWNQHNDWISFKKQLAHSAVAVADPLKSLSTFVVTQVGVVTPLILAFCLWGMGWALWVGWRERRPDWFVLGATSAPVLAYFVHRSLGALVQPHWAGPAYLGAIIATAGAWSRARPPRWLRWVHSAAPVLAAIMLAGVYVQMSTAMLPLPPRADALSRLGGWDEIAGAVARQAAAHPDAFIYVQKHEMNGLLTYYLPGHPKIFLTGSAGAPRLPLYDQTDVAALAGRSGLFVTRAGGQFYGLEDVARDFAKITLLDSVERKWGGRVIDRYEIWLTEGYRRGSFGEFETSGEGTQP